MALYVAFGSYVGNAVDGRSITDDNGNGTGLAIGFAPKAVVIKALSGAADIWRFDSMAGDTSDVGGTAAFAANLIESLDALGFTIGSDNQVNQSGVTYRFMAIGGSDVSCLTWTGSGAARNITGVGFQPTFAYIVGNALVHGHIKTPEMAAAYSLAFTGGAFGGTNAITGFLADGVSLGSATGVNQAGTEHHGLFIRDVAGVFDTLSYVGNGTNPRTVTGASFAPESVIVKRDSLSVPAWRHPRHTGSNSQLIQQSAGTDSVLYITSLTATGFTTTNDNAVNANTNTYYALIFTDNRPAVGAIHELAGVGTIALEASAAMAPLRRLVSSPASIALEGSGRLVAGVAALAGVAELELSSGAPALVTGTQHALAGVAEITFASSGELGIIRPLAGVAELAILAGAPVLEAFRLVYLTAAAAGLELESIAALSVPFRTLEGVAEIELIATSRVYNPDAEDGSQDGEAPGGGLAILRYPEHWRSLRVGDIVNAITPNAGIGGSSPVLRLLAITAVSGDTAVDCLWQYYEETTEINYNRSQGAAKPFARERLPRVLADALQTSNAATGRRRP